MIYLRTLKRDGKCKCCHRSIQAHEEYVITFRLINSSCTLIVICSNCVKQMADYVKEVDDKLANN